MKAVSILYDGRIRAHNALFDMSVEEYLTAVAGVLAKNPFQRKRVAASKTVYSLLRKDIEQGCVIPPIVLALANSSVEQGNLSEEKAAQLVTENDPELLILDGLQRTYTLIEAAGNLDPQISATVKGSRLRVEIYIGLNRIGILYRMLTLNTGQTPMSLRQQIEMLYLDYLDTDVDGVKFVREVDEQHATTFGELNFKETIEGFNSYLERNELPLDRSDLLENIRSLENLSVENSQKDIFRDFVMSWIGFLKKVNELCGAVELPAEQITSIALVWGKTAMQVFRKPQVLTGFGAALGKLKDLKVLAELGDVQTASATLTLGQRPPEDFLIEINGAMLWIASNTKKIGNAQRMFFFYYFRELFNPEGDSYLDITSSVASAQHKLESQLL
jgi:hypothetical protein